MYRIIILFFIANLSQLTAGWEFDNFVSVNSKDVKVIKNSGNYFSFEKVNNAIVLTQISPQKVIATIIDTNFTDMLIDIDLDSNSLIYNSFSYINYYNYKENKLLAKLPIKPCDNICLDENYFYVAASNLDVVNCRTETNTLLQVFDIKNRTQQLYAFPDPKGIDLTCFSTRKVIALIDTLIAINEVSEYKVKFYNRNYDLVDSLSYEPDMWKQFNGIIPQYDCGPNIAGHIEKCRYIIYNYSQIWLLNTLNDSTLMISWGTGTTDSGRMTDYKHYHDIWVKKNGVWKLHNTINQNGDDTDVFNFSAMGLADQFYIKHGYLYIITPFPIDFVKKYYGKSYSEFENEMNNFYINNDLQYTCFIYKYVP